MFNIYLTIKIFKYEYNSYAIFDNLRKLRTKKFVRHKIFVTINIFLEKQ